MLSDGWHPDDATEFNGAAWPCLGSALWALRTTTSFKESLAAAIDLGGDTDTVAAVTGALAGAVYGIEAVPERWTAPLHVPLPGFGGRVLRLASSPTWPSRWPALLAVDSGCGPADDGQRTGNIRTEGVDRHVRTP
ncbi:hypothetical protein RKD30_001416 [Streptomyces pristinaespiralis]